MTGVDSVGNRVEGSMMGERPGPPAPRVRPCLQFHPYRLERSNERLPCVRSDRVDGGSHGGNGIGAERPEVGDIDGVFRIGPGEIGLGDEPIRIECHERHDRNQTGDERAECERVSAAPQHRDRSQHHHHGDPRHERRRVDPQLAQTELGGVGQHPHECRPGHHQRLDDEPEVQQIERPDSAGDDPIDREDERQHTRRCEDELEEALPRVLGVSDVDAVRPAHRTDR